jgi:integrase
MKKITDNWMAKSKQFWQEFRDCVEVKTLREITQEHVVEYYDMISNEIAESGLAPSYARQRFGAIRTMIKFPQKRGKWALDSQKALAFCEVLVKPKATDADPHPVGVRPFHDMLAAADPEMTAMLLLMLNGCMYGGEVAERLWSEIDFDNGTMTTRRTKTGVIRVAVLWDRTIAALKALLRSDDDMIFRTEGTRMQHNYQTVYKAFKALRKRVPSASAVQLSHIRDGAFTASVRAKVEMDYCRIYAGHATGMSDRYIARDPEMVEDACKAVERRYFGSMNIGQSFGRKGDAEAESQWSHGDLNPKFNHAMVA